MPDSSPCEIVTIRSLSRCSLIFHVDVFFHFSTYWRVGGVCWDVFERVICFSSGSQMSNILVDFFRSILRYTEKDFTEKNSKYLTFYLSYKSHFFFSWSDFWAPQFYLVVLQGDIIRFTEASPDFLREGGISFGLPCISLCILWLRFFLIFLFIHV